MVRWENTERREISTNPIGLGEKAPILSLWAHDRNRRDELTGGLMIILSKRLIKVAAVAVTQHRSNLLYWKIRAPKKANSTFHSLF